jgi:hypothetical protein
MKFTIFCGRALGGRRGPGGCVGFVMRGDGEGLNPKMLPYISFVKIVSKYK